MPQRNAYALAWTHEAKEQELRRAKYFRHLCSHTQYGSTVSAVNVTKHKVVCASCLMS